jgi:Raf kinase inhibitor-like YbhB/YbcL family protein
MRGAAYLGALLTLSVIGASGAARADFTLTSPDITEGGTIKNEQVFNGFGCKGDNMAPALSWSGAPAGTKSYAVTVYDPDAPTGSGFWHWVLFDIPTKVTSLPKGPGGPKTKHPAGSVEVRTDFGVPGYGGPCPPMGDKPHRYIFTVFAVDAEHLGPNKSVSPAIVGFNLHFHSLAKASLTATYGR